MKNQTENNCLSTEKHWSDRWLQTKIRDITFNPNQPMFADLHRLFSRILPKDESFKLLEIGAFPGSYMWYFNKFFCYQVSGLEYVGWCCEEAKKLLENAGIHAEMIHCDLLKSKHLSEDRRWDVVTSFGFVEHFETLDEVIKLHLDLLKQNGFLILVIPNHQGFYGRIMRKMNIKKYEVHNRIGYEDLIQAPSLYKRTEILEGGYYGHFGFWNCGLYTYLKECQQLPYILARSPFYLLEQLGQLIPNSRRLSPNIAVVARKV